MSVGSVMSVGSGRPGGSPEGADRRGRRGWASGRVVVPGDPVESFGDQQVLGAQVGDGGDAEAAQRGVDPAADDVLSLIHI